ncbi:unnamed protein product [Caenorhabditis auriculariae]|uniref:Cytochrome b5 heme-binding domain-containing protein n=1 Tax=Caenorhabditis auriculariae TaxID=2777116 RepID=A0A8S1GZV0_9PELO|nr:unnamed protein product [Caenorhabditis auriculariae]
MVIAVNYAYSLTEVDILLILLGLFLIYKFFWTKKHYIDKPKPSEGDPVPMQDFTLEELKKFNQANPDNLLVAIDRKVYDLTKSRKMYQDDKNLLECLENLADPTPSTVDKEELIKWHKLFERKYPLMALMFPCHIPKAPVKWNEHLWSVEVTPTVETFLTTVFEHRRDAQFNSEQHRHLTEMIVKMPNEEEEIADE